MFQGGLTALAVLKYRKGVSEDFAGGYGADGMSGGPTQPTPSPYSAYPSTGGGAGAGGYPPTGGYTGGETGDPYQQAPFAGGVPEQKQAPGDFQPPTY